MTAQVGLQHFLVVAAVLFALGVFVVITRRNAVAVLMGSSTYSAAEDFLAFMRAVPNCVFVGGPSAGSTGQPLTFEIPGGAVVGITSKRDTMPDGTEFVGIGVMPDIAVSQSLEAFRDGRDPVLERAVEELEARLR